MKTGIIVQARMSSRRFPGKSLSLVAGKPLLSYLLDTISRVKEACLFCIATSKDGSDDPIVEFCKTEKILCFRGSLKNVAERYLSAAKNYELDAFVRVTGDSPCLSLEVIQKAMTFYKEDRYDLVTNTYERTFPKGQSVEVIRTQAFESMFPRMTEPSDQEHVTRFFYRNAKDFRIFNFKFPIDLSSIQLSVDTPWDKELIENLIRRMPRPHWQYGVSEIVSLLESRREAA